jgi:hypothetical protein
VVPFFCCPLVTQSFSSVVTKLLCGCASMQLKVPPLTPGRLSSMLGLQLKGLVDKPTPTSHGVNRRIDEVAAVIHRPDHCMAC